MLKSILNDSRLNNCHKATKTTSTTTIILIPPTTLYQQTPFSFDYLASHVIPAVDSEPLTSRLQKKKKDINRKILNSEYQVLFTLNEHVVYQTNNGHIIHYHDSSSSRRAKIIHTEFMYMNPENHDDCTHLILYLDQDLIMNNTNTDLKMQQQELNHHLSFQDRMKSVFPNNNNSNDILHSIDKLVLKFCDTSVNCDSLKSLHDCMESVLDEGYDLIEQLDLSCTNDLGVIFGSFESYIMESTYDVVFFKITQLLLQEDKVLTAALEDMEHLDFSQIGLPDSIKDERKRVRLAISEFERIGSFRTPAEKLDCLLNTVSELTRDNDNVCNSTATFLDSDSLIPLLLMTLIKSKVPHLTANLIYMKEYTFERNIVTGKYGYALSTFEGVLDYILEAHSDLQKLSQQNIEFWSAIETGDLREVIQCGGDSHDLRDVHGNNALMIACIHHQARIVECLLKSSNTSALTAVNDMNSTPLMLAVRQGKQSLETIRILLRNPEIVQTVNTSFDNYGNTAILYACEIDNLDILKALLEVEDVDMNWDQHINTLTGDSMLHVAARNGCSLDFMKYIMDHCEKHLLSHNNIKKETFYHLCRNKQFVKELLKSEDSKHPFMNMIDQTGRSPLMTWANKGRLDLVELVVTHYANDTFIDYSRVDKHGKNMLHLLTMHLSSKKGFTHGEKSLDYLVEKFRKLVNVRDWSHGNTPLHLASEMSTFASSSVQNVTNTVSFIRALVKYGAVMDAPNYRDEYPIDVSKIPQITTLLDELHLKVDPSFAPIMKHSMYQYSWYVTRPLIEQGIDDQNSTELYYIVKSGQIGKPESMRTVKRKFQDFLFLRTELLYEMPEIFLPSFQRLTDPLMVDLKPPPLAWIHLTLHRFQTFMNWLQYHPVLRYHDLVISFVRSSAELQRSMIRDNSFSRRKLQLEKISDSPLPNSVMSSKDEEHFLTYAQDMMRPLKDDFLHVLLTGRSVLEVSQELKREMSMVAQYATDLGHSVPILPLAIETIRICANITCDRSYISPWTQLFRLCQMAYDMLDGILLSLNRPFTLLKERNTLRENIEQQKEVLRKSKNWQSIFLLKDRKKLIEYDKSKVIQHMNELNHIDGQINQSHKMISDELAHFQNIHPKEMIKSIKHVSRSALAMEKHKLAVLEQTLSSWNNNCTTTVTP